MIQPVADDERDAFELLELKHRGWWGIHGKEFNSTFVAGEGAYNSPEVMIIGEAPGAEEALRGRPFVGPSGMVLRRLMAHAGLQASNRGNVPSNCWLTNVIKFRPPRNRTPILREVMAVRHLLRLEWQAIGRPRIIIPVGGVALFAVLGERWSVLKTAGTPHYVHSERSNMDLVLWPMIHPSYVLRQKSEELQSLVERDWKRLGDWSTVWERDNTRRR